MPNRPRLLSYSDFIKVLILMECCIPAFPQEYDREFLIFRWGGNGYSARPSGDRAPFIHRENSTPVTRLEIRKTLKLLDIEEELFWDFVEKCMVKLMPPKTASTPAQEAQPAPPPPDPDPNKSSC